jgi:hypothetical protein
MSQKERYDRFIKAHPTYHADKSKIRREKNPSSLKDWANSYKDKVFSHYGSYCHCPGCDEDRIEFLTIEHRNGRKKGVPWHCNKKGNRQSTYCVYKAIVDYEFPDDITILCYNCNCSKSKGCSNKCPVHQGDDMVNKNYQKGRSKEYKSMKILRDAGYICFRSAGSHGPFDIIAFNKTGLRLIQVKSDCSPTPVEMEFLKEFNDVPMGSSKELWTYHKGSSIPVIDKF